METIIRATRGWQPVDLRELWRYKDLLYFLTLLGKKAKYRFAAFDSLKVISFYN
ncbi:MAG: hypothetical protein KIPDCIKN_03880 [Haliscomenobacter sp.]|nr:hypothetical protein [Haliscomenobacter sp.]